MDSPEPGPQQGQPQQDQPQQGPPQPEELPIRFVPGPNATPEQIELMQRQIAHDAEQAGMTVPQFVAKIKAQQAAQQQLTPEQMQEMQKRLKHDADQAGMTIPEFVAKIRSQQLAHQAAQQQLTPEQMQQQQAQRQAAMQQQQQQQQQQPIQPGPPNPAAIALANFLKSQDLKSRICLLNGQRRDMFKVKRALRAIKSPAYEKARKKNPLLPVVTDDRASLENCFKLLPLSLLALRVSKSDPHEGHDHAPGAHHIKRVKGLWTVKIEQQQECQDDLHFVWLYEGAQIKQKLYAAGFLALAFALVMFPLWPIKVRLGVWYLSMGMLGLLGLFFAMAIFRLILFGMTMFVVPPGLWLYPNLFEDVGFFDSFRPVWGWQEEKKKGKKKKTKSSGSANAGATMASMTGQPAPASATTTGSSAQISTGETTQRNLAPRVEEIFDEE
ncbi:Translocation protein S62 [Ciborinia camelliae]|nr:Translocation protein S62 [Ciborinia camelliae]